jgi:hypothetical protein
MTAERLGTAAGLFRTFGHVGSIGSSAMIGIVFHSGVTDGGLHLIGPIMAAVSVAALAITAPILKAVGKGFHSDSPATAVHGDIAPQPGDIDVHQFLTTKVFPSQARVVRVADLEELLSASGAGA